LTLKVAGII